jgi:hypothetical protein
MASHLETGGKDDSLCNFFAYFVLKTILNMDQMFGNNDT